MNNCEGCKRKLPIHAGIHVSELEYIFCTQEGDPLDAKRTYTWHVHEKAQQSTQPTITG
jgi:hypothetical protein